MGKGFRKADVLKHLEEYEANEKLISTSKMSTMDDYFKEYEKDQAYNETINQIKEKIPENLVDLYPLAREKHRHFILHIGETNTGKTYNAIKRFHKAASGVYLAPLRLLALEIQEEAERNHVPCTYLTGEEELIREGANHVSSTIEKLDIRQEYDVAVIDEAQLLSDPSRGGAWTRAILGVLADEVHICCSPNAEKLVITLIETCGDTYEVEYLERKTSLVVEKKKMRDVKPNDALVVFSRNKVLALESELREKGIKASIIYGSLPYSVRKHEMQKFLDGETNVVIATDAIGMGLNLPIERVIFMESEKFDGRERRALLLPEIKQIAGRAGRYGLFDKGLVTANGPTAWLKESLAMEYTDLTHCVLPIPESLLNVKGHFIDNLLIWQEFNFPDYYTKPDLSVPLTLAEVLNEYGTIFSNRTIYNLITLPVDKSTMKLYKKLVEGMVTGEVDRVIGKVLNEEPKTLNELETHHKELDVIYSFSGKFSYDKYKESIMFQKESNALAIMEVLKQPYKHVCEHCEETLAWDFSYTLCQDCYEQGHIHNR